MLSLTKRLAHRVSDSTLVDGIAKILVRNSASSLLFVHQIHWFWWYKDRQWDELGGI